MSGYIVIPQANTVYVEGDDMSLCNAESRLLKSAQYRVIRFELAEQFRQSDFKRSTDCLLLDIRLPVIGGIELQGTAVCPRDSNPVIFMT
jgi:FixJ family two-component response regulator